MKSGVSLRCARSMPGAYVSFLAPGKTDYTACHPRRTTTYILHVVSITTHTHDRRKSTGKKKQRKEKKIKERKEKTRNVIHPWHTFHQSNQNQMDQQLNTCIKSNFFCFSRSCKLQLTLRGRSGVPTGTLPRDRFIIEEAVCSTLNLLYDRSANFSLFLKMST